MRSLDRALATEPQCLATYAYPAQTWDDFGGDCKKKLRHALAEMQGIPGMTDLANDVYYGLRCAYCDGFIRSGGHIEHFRRRLHFANLTFTWDNLFISCDSETHCGHYKDGSSQRTYNADELIKPDGDDPHKFLFFSSTGRVEPRTGLSKDEETKAVETIRIFHLNERSLVSKRAKAVSGLVHEFTKMAEEYYGELMPSSTATAREEIEDLLNEFLDSERERNLHAEYFSAVADVIESNKI